MHVLYRNKLYTTTGETSASTTRPIAISAWTH